MFWRVSIFSLPRRLHFPPSHFFMFFLLISSYWFPSPSRLFLSAAFPSLPPLPPLPSLQPLRPANACGCSSDWDNCCSPGRGESERRERQAKMRGGSTHASLLHLAPSTPIIIIIASLSHQRQKGAMAGGDY